MQIKVQSASLSYGRYGSVKWHVDIANFSGYVGNINIQGGPRERHS